MYWQPLCITFDIRPPFAQMDRIIALKRAMHFAIGPFKHIRLPGCRIACMELFIDVFRSRRSGYPSAIKHSVPSANDRAAASMACRNGSPDPMHARQHPSCHLRRNRWSYLYESSQVPYRFPIAPSAYPAVTGIPHSLYHHRRQSLLHVLIISSLLSP